MKAGSFTHPMNIMMCLRKKARGVDNVKQILVGKRLYNARLLLSSTEAGFRANIRRLIARNA
jgi:hypothetical protein